MTPGKKDLVKNLENSLESLDHRDSNGLDALLKRSKMIIRNIFGDSSGYLTELSRVRFYPAIYPASSEDYDEDWNRGKSQLQNLYTTMVEELEIFGEGEQAQSTNPPKTAGTIKKSKNTRNGAKVFIVHGHDEAAKSKVARFTGKLDIQPIILHERPNGGRTIIEKFEDESRVDFAIVLLTADDVGSAANSKDGLLARARQNVIFELGYFIGVLGRSKVVALREAGVEIPSDYSGILYVDFDDKDNWRLELAREIKNGGLDIDLNQAI